MKPEQIKEFLREVINNPEILDDIDCSKKTNICMCYVAENYKNINEIRPVLSQLLELYYKGDVQKRYAIQFIPCIIGCYLQAIAEKEHISVSIFETFFLTIYNEEIMEGEPGCDTTDKKIEEIHIPSSLSRFSSVSNNLSESTDSLGMMKADGDSSFGTTIISGPYPSYSNISAENKFIILTRLMKSVNNFICVLGTENLPVGYIPRFICLTALSIALSGLTFTETDLRIKVLEGDLSEEVLEDFSKRSRQQVNSSILLEFLSGVYVSLFNGEPDLALRAIDAIHQRANYEMMFDVILITNAIRNSLLENPLSKEKREEVILSRNYQKDMRRKNSVSNASLHNKLLPEDITFQSDIVESTPKKLDDEVKTESEDIITVYSYRRVEFVRNIK